MTIVQKNDYIIMWQSLEPINYYTLYKNIKTDLNI